MEYIQYKALGTVFEYSVENMNYYHFLCVGRKISKETVEQLKKEFHKLGSIEAVVDENNSLADDIYDEVLEKMCDYFQKCQIYSVDSELLDRHCEEYVNEFYKKLLDLYLDPYLDIVCDEKEAREYRKARKQNRSRAVGYGFGVSGYIKASMQAGAVNMVTGMGHSLVNSVGNAATKVGASIQKSSLYNDKTRFTSLTEACELMVWKIIQKSMGLMSHYGKIEIEPDSKEDRDVASALLNNLMNGKIPEEQRFSTVCKILQMDPLLYGGYTSALELYGDKDGSLKSMAADFGVNLNKYIETKLENKYGSILTKKYTDEKEVLSLKNEIEELSQFYGIESENKYISYLDNAWIEIDKRLRTANGIEFETREEANDYRDDLQLFESFVQQQNFNILDLLDEKVVKQLTEEIDTLAYKSQHIHEDISSMLEMALCPYIETQQRIRNIEDSSNPVEEVKTIIRENNVYGELSKRISFSSLCNGKERKITQCIQPMEKIVFIQDCSMIGTWSVGVIYTDRRIIISGKNNVMAVSLQNIKTIMIKERALMIVTSDNQEIVSDTLRGMSDEQYKIWSKVLNDITEGMKRVVPKIRMIFCTQCGKEIPQNVKFCTFCGGVNKYRMEV
ncbi:MAG: zinc ribbon domain-containing protein [Lachnospiraceae bacterium]|nr:zinc ribbon domain-containing protein [Lachnospiraceae bacterium]